jgi:hypothetical protein
MIWLEDQIEKWGNHGVGGLMLALDGLANLKLNFIFEAIGGAAVWCIAFMGAVVLTPFAILHVLLTEEEPEDVV